MPTKVREINFWGISVWKQPAGSVTVKHNYLVVEFWIFIPNQIKIIFEFIIAIYCTWNWHFRKENFECFNHVSQNWKLRYGSNLESVLCQYTVSIWTRTVLVDMIQIWSRYESGTDLRPPFMLKPVSVTYYERIIIIIP